MDSSWKSVSNIYKLVFESNKSTLMDYLLSRRSSTILNSLRKQFPLFTYAIRYIFEHAKSYEVENRQSTYHLLQKYVASSGEIFKLHCLATSAMSYHHGSRGHDCRSCNSGCKFGFLSDGSIDGSTALLRITALHGLLLYCQDAVKAENVAEGKEELLSCSISSSISSSENGSQLISLMLESGATITDAHIFQAIESATPAALSRLLDTPSPKRENASHYLLGVEHIWGDVWGKLKILFEWRQDCEAQSHEKHSLWNMTKNRRHITKYDKDWERIKLLIIKDTKASSSAKLTAWMCGETTLIWPGESIDIIHEI